MGSDARGGSPGGDGGARQAFRCCKVASVVHGRGRMIGFVADDTQKVIQITGGDPGYWSCSNAD